MNSEDKEFGLPNISISHYVLYNPCLTNTEKILYGFIKNLSFKEKGCWATNDYLGNLIDCVPRKVSAMITKLEKYKYIIREMWPKSTKTNETTRHLFLNPEMDLFYNEFNPDIIKVYLRNEIGKDTLKDNINNKIEMLSNNERGMDFKVRGDGPVGLPNKILNTSLDSNVLPSDAASRHLGNTLLDSPAESRKKTKLKRRNKKTKPKTKIPYSKDVIDIIDYWNDLKHVRKHRPDKERTFKQDALSKTCYKAITKIVTALNSYSKEDIISTLTTFSNLCGTESTYFGYKNDKNKRQAISLDQLFDSATLIERWKEYKNPIMSNVEFKKGESIFERIKRSKYPQTLFTRPGNKSTPLSDQAKKFSAQIKIYYCRIQGLDEKDKLSPKVEDHFVNGGNNLYNFCRLNKQRLNFNTMEIVKKLFTYYSDIKKRPQPEWFSNSDTIRYFSDYLLKEGDLIEKQIMRY